MDGFIAVLLGFCFFRLLSISVRLENQDRRENEREFKISKMPIRRRKHHIPITRPKKIYKSQVS
jgi:hypothetical protein